ncbi:atherin-like isoform X2 [Sorex araneus]|uniref:atherin-like isoform X2 n=1 Tax=Sorex araneus TaxID=42254 RepID=UPI00243352A6|nr:atherin-like isoform X2 [Sorex araneus]
MASPGRPPPPPTCLFSLSPVRAPTAVAASGGGAGLPAPASLPAPRPGPRGSTSPSRAALGTASSHSPSSQPATGRCSRAGAAGVSPTERTKTAADGHSSRLKLKQRKHLKPPLLPRHPPKWCHFSP